MSLDSAVTALLSRLETITNRLESVERQLASGGGSSGGSSASNSNSGGSGDDSVSVREYEDLISQFIQPYVDISRKLGAADVAEQAELVLQAVNAQRDMLKVAAASKKPSDSVFQSLIQPTSDLMARIVALRDKGRTSKHFNHLSTVSEGIGALGWVCVSPTPGPHVADMRGGSEFYSNRILKEFKGNSQIHVDWVNGFNGYLKELQVFIKKHHTTGLTWNPRGGDASSVSVSSSSSSSSDSFIPPPPGPPPPPLTEEEMNRGVAPSKGPDISGVLASLNKGEAVTSGLKKVTNDMKTKNRTDKSSVVPANIAKDSKATSAGGKKDTPSKPPKFALEGNKWTVEWQVNNKNVVISDTEAKQTVYIYKCKGTTVQIKGKVNAITIDDCSKTAVVFENCIASVEVVNSNSVEIQVIGRVPSFAIDKTSGCQLYLSKDSLDSEIVTSKSSEMNVLIPGATADQDLVEMAIPEQYKTFVRNGKLITETVAHV